MRVSDWSSDVCSSDLIVLEGVLESIAIEITQKVACPTIGIGASAQCDGQVLVTDDMLGMFERVPKFVKRYQDMAGVINGAVKDYAKQVRSRSFPTEDQIYAGDRKSPRLNSRHSCANRVQSSAW